MPSKGTALVRINKNLKKELESNFPDVRMADLMNVMYRTSALRLENVLRRNKKK